MSNIQLNSPTEKTDVLKSSTFQVLTSHLQVSV